MKKEVIGILNRPFEESIIKKKKGKDGDELSYVEASHYIKRLNEAFDGDWSFEIVDMKRMRNEVIVLGKLVAGGIVKMQYGSAPISGSSIGDDVKAAGTDALKKCASLLGIGLHLYETEKKDTSRRLTSNQLSMIESLRKRLNITKEALNERTKKAFGKSLEYISIKEASQLIDEMKKEAGNGR